MIFGSGLLPQCVCSSTHKWFTVLALLFFAGTMPAAEPPIRLDGGIVELEGDATLHGWHCESAGAYVRIDPGFELEPVYAYLRELLQSPPDDLEEILEKIRRFQAQGVSVEIRTPVASLDCGSRGLERDLARAVRAEKHPVIHFEFLHLEDMSIRNNPAVHVLTLHTKGGLTLAGNHRRIDMDVNMSLLDDGSIHMSMERDLLMTDYGVKPPTALFGLIRARDRFSFAYEWTVKPE